MAYQACPQQDLDSADDSRCKYLDIESLLRMSPVVNNQDLAQLASRYLFLSILKSQPSVQETFFPDRVHHLLEDQVDHDWFDFDSFAVLFVCQTLIELNDDYGIRDMLDVEKVYNDLGEMYNSSEWKKLGFALYTMVFGRVVKDEFTKQPFSAFVEENRQSWAAELEARVTGAQWVYNLTHSHLTEDEIKERVNLVLLKLHLLHPPSATTCYHKLSKDIPDLSLNLVTKNYLGNPLDWRLLRPEVERILNAEVFPGHRRYHLTSEEVEVFVGVRVTEFIMEHARALGLWSGNYAYNRKVLNMSNRCLLM